jgi:transcriptional regulator with XRE-family HTH domain
VRRISYQGCSVTRQPKTTFRRRQLARTLRRLRADAGLSQAGAADKLHINHRTMSRIELGHQVPGYHDLRAMLDLYGLTVDVWDPYLTMAERARERGWYQAYGLDDYGYVSMEDEASQIREVQPSFVPGLLQTSDYVRSLFDNTSQPFTESDVELAVEIRRRRQKRLISPTDPIGMHAVLDETVLRRELPPRVMRDQLNYLVLAAELETVTIQVLPKSIGNHEGLHSNFALLSFPDEDEPDVGYVEHVAGSVLIEKESGVTKCKLAFDDLARRALSHEESVRLIERLADET